jgi:hypothetical protein
MASAVKLLSFRCSGISVSNAKFPSAVHPFDIAYMPTRPDVVATVHIFFLPTRNWMPDSDAPVAIAINTDRCVPRARSRSSRFEDWDDARVVDVLVVESIANIRCVNVHIIDPMI